MNTKIMISDEYLLSLGKALRSRREELNLSQENLAEKCQLDRTYIGGVERGERNISILNLNKIINSLEIPIYEFFILVEKFRDPQFVSSKQDITYGMRKLKAIEHLKFLEIFPESRFKSIEKIIEEGLQAKSAKARDVISSAFKFAVDNSPEENISDIWHHIVYRIYLEKKITGNAEQSWARTSGDAFEQFILDEYSPYLMQKDYRLQILTSGKVKQETLKRLNLEDKIGSAKIDLVLEKKGAGRSIVDDYGIVAAIHAKVSLAERVSDDIPASRILMNEGIKSILVTLDVKSFPPPMGDLINRGELGSVEKPSDKRKYIEEHGEFSACISYNSRTVPSPETTSSGKKIFCVSQISSFDAFMSYILKNI